MLKVLCTNLLNNALKNKKVIAKVHVILGHPRGKNRQFDWVGNRASASCLMYNKNMIHMNIINSVENENLTSSLSMGTFICKRFTINKLCLQLRHIEVFMITAVWTHLRMFQNSKLYQFMLNVIFCLSRC
jgi:hypothetical protein